MPHAPVQVHVRLKKNFKLHCPSIQNPQVQFSCKDMKKALELFMDVADTKPKHKALGTNGKGCRENLRSSISIWYWI